MDSYSEVADQQLDEIEVRDPALYDAVLTAWESIFDHPDRVQSLSGAITTEQGIRMVLPVPGFPQYKAFWSAELSRVEAVFPYDFRSRSRQHRPSTNAGAGVPCLQLGPGSDLSEEPASGFSRSRRIT